MELMEEIMSKEKSKISIYFRDSISYLIFTRKLIDDRL
jgi:hypothetical protein